MKTLGSFITVFVLILLCGTAQAECAPGSVCYQLCPEVDQETSYNNAGRALHFLFNGEGSWIFATELDLREDFLLSPVAMDGLARLKKLFDHYGTTVVIVYLPPRGIMYPEKLKRPAFPAEAATRSYLAAAEQLRSLGYIVPDFRPLLPDKSGSFYQRRDHHWNTPGAQKTAALVADLVKKVPIYPHLEKKEFVTQRLGIFGKYGTLSTLGIRICEKHFPRQYVETYTTLAKNSSDDEANLFGESKSTADVVLIGTSNSKGKVNYNFAGFMEEYLSVPIDNRALRGGGYNGALEQIIVDGMFRKHPPKVLIWELPAQFPLDEPMFYRVVVPELAGGCRKELLSGKATASETEADALYNGNNGVTLPLKSKDYLLKFKFSDPSIYSFFLTLTYLSGEHEKVKVERHPFVKHDGTFYLNLPDSGKFADDTLFSVSLHLPPPTEKKSDVEVQVCQRNAI